MVGSDPGLDLVLGCLGGGIEPGFCRVAEWIALLDSLATMRHVNIWECDFKFSAIAIQFSALMRSILCSFLC